MKKFVLILTATCLVQFSGAQCLVAYYPFTGNAGDSSGFGNDGTVFSAILANDRFGVSNAAYEFGSGADGIEVPSSPNLELDSQYTISCWINPLTTYGTGPNYHAILCKWGGNGNASYLLCLTPDGRPRLVTHDGFTNTELVANASVQLGTWSALSVSQSHDTVWIYINGSLDTMATAMNVPMHTMEPVWIGANVGGISGDSFEGVIDEVRIFNCNVFPSSQCLVGYYPFTGNAVDSSGSGNNGNVFGATLAVDRFGASNSAYEFGTGADGIEVASSSSLLLDSSYTISCWINPLTVYGTGPNYYAIVGKWGGNGNASYMLCLTPNGQPRLVTHDGVTNTELIAASSIPLATWTYISATQSHDTAWISINGIQDTIRTGMNIPMHTAQPIWIGANTGGISGDSFEGVIDEVRIYNCSSPFSGIEDAGLADRLLIYPNPSSGFVYLSNHAFDSIQVLNTLGKQINVKVQGDSIDLSHLPEGIYSLVITYQAARTHHWVVKVQ